MSSKKPRVLSFSPSDEEMSKLDQVVQANQPWLTRYAVHKLAMRLGLDQLLADPDLARRLVAASRR